MILRPKSRAEESALFRSEIVEHGLDRATHEDGHTTVRLRWQVERPNALWHGDVCHGAPLALPNGQRSHVHRQRPAPGLRAAGHHAHPRQAYDAPARGKMERFWRTLREGCLDQFGTMSCRTRSTSAYTPSSTSTTTARPTPASWAARPGRCGASAPPSATSMSWTRPPRARRSSSTSACAYARTACSTWTVRSGSSPPASWSDTWSRCIARSSSPTAPPGSSTRANVCRACSLVVVSAPGTGLGDISEQQAESISPCNQIIHSGCVPGVLREPLCISRARELGAVHPGTPAATAAASPS
jgi:hypothetical protein